MINHNQINQPREGAVLFFFFFFLFQLSTLISYSLVLEHKFLSILSLFMSFSVVDVHAVFWSCQ